MAGSERSEALLSHITKTYGVTGTAFENVLKGSLPKTKEFNLLLLLNFKDGESGEESPHPSIFEGLSVKAINRALENSGLDSLLGDRTTSSKAGCLDIDAKEALACCMAMESKDRDAMLRVADSVTNYATRFGTYVIRPGLSKYLDTWRKSRVNQLNCMANNISVYAQTNSELVSQLSGKKRQAIRSLIDIIDSECIFGATVATAAAAATPATTAAATATTTATTTPVTTTTATTTATATITDAPKLLRKTPAADIPTATTVTTTTTTAPTLVSDSVCAYNNQGLMTITDIRNAITELREGMRVTGKSVRANSQGIVGLNKDVECIRGEIASVTNEITNVANSVRDTQDYYHQY